MGVSNETMYGVCSRSVVGEGCSTCRRFESSKMKMGRRLLGASNTVSGVAVQGDLGWRKMEERREEMKVVVVKRLSCWKRTDRLKEVANKLR